LYTSLPPFGNGAVVSSGVEAQKKLPEKKKGIGFFRESRNVSLPIMKNI
jgi:hypothetical protein